MSGTFLSRWSRRKLDAGREEASSAPAPEPAEPAEGPGTPAAAGEAAGERPGAITPEELAALPAVEDLTAVSDLAGFLREGVPAALRNAALRRVWAIDPAIRDFVGEARDYAWDWNVPGGVPGFGPAEAAADLRGLSEDFFSRPAAAGEVAERENVMVRSAAAEPAAPKAPAEEAAAPASRENAGESAHPAPPEEPADEVPQRPRHHGGALPV